jgi:hypothetical protein
VNLQLQADLDDIERRNAKARDQPCGSASKYHLSLGPFIFEMMAPG